MTSYNFSHFEGYTKDADDQYKAELIPCEECGGKRHPEYGCPTCDDDIPEDVKHLR